MEIIFLTPHLAIQTVNHNLKTVNVFCTNKKRSLRSRKAIRKYDCKQKKQTLFTQIWNEGHRTQGRLKEHLY